MKLDKIGGGGPVQVNPFAATCRSIAVDDSNAYVTVDYGDNCHGIVRMPKMAGNTVPTPLRMGPGFFPYTIAIDDQSVYWLDRNAGEVRKMAK